MTEQRPARHGARLLTTSLLALILPALVLPGPTLGQGGGPSPPQQRGPDQGFILGADGWVLERFGRDLAILRTGVRPATGPGGLLVLSCEGRERRWRLSLPQPMLAPLLDPMPASTTAGDILLRPSGSPDRRDRALFDRAEIKDRRVLALAETRSSGDGCVPAFVRLLKAGPERFDLLMRPAGPALSHRLFGSAVPAAVFTPVVRRSDRIAFDDFLATCLAGSE